MMGEMDKDRRCRRGEVYGEVGEGSSLVCLVS